MSYSHPKGRTYCRLMLFENRVVKKALGPKREEIGG
jgi:hypothetical protein